MWHRQRWLGIGVVTALGMLSLAPALQADAPDAQTPWRTFAYGRLHRGYNRQIAAGYQFTPMVNGRITALGGCFNGTKAVKLFDTTTGAELASVQVTAANAWVLVEIAPVPVRAGIRYTVAVYLAGSGGAYRSNLRPRFPRRFGDIRIDGATLALTSLDPAARPRLLRRNQMWGEVDIQFLPETAAEPDTTPPRIELTDPVDGAVLDAT